MASQNKKAPEGAEFNRNLMSYLASHEEERVTLFIPAGIISGTLQSLAEPPEPTIQLSDAHLLVGDQKLSFGDLTIMIEQIYGWGGSFPSSTSTL